MKRKVHLRKKYFLKKGKVKKGTVFILSLVLALFAVFFIFRYVSYQLTPKLERYAESELKRFNTLIINKMVIKEINDTISIEDLFVISKDSNDSIHTIDFNPIAVNRLLSIMTSSFEKLNKEIMKI